MFIKKNSLLLQHLDQLVLIEQSCFKHLAWTKTDFESELNNSQSLNFSCFDQDVLMAYVFIRPILDEIHLINIAVDPKFQKQRIGTKLLKSICEYALSNHLRKIFLEVRKSNEQAFEFYKSLNFKVEFESPCLYSKGNQKERAGIRMSLVIGD